MSRPGIHCVEMQYLVLLVLLSGACTFVFQYAGDINIENMLFISNEDGEEFSNMISLAKVCICS